MRYARGMNTKLIRIHRGVLLTALGAATLVRAALADEPTAFQLVKEGNRHLGEDARDRVVQIR